MATLSPRTSPWTGPGGRLDLGLSRAKERAGDGWTDEGRSEAESA